MTYRILVERPRGAPCVRWQLGASERDCRRFVIVRTLTPLNSD
jgi:hypothetical protein